MFSSPVYLEKFGTPERLADLKNHRLILFDNPFIKFPYKQTLWFLKLLSSSGEGEPEPFMVLNSVECLYQAAIAGLGIISLSNDSNLLQDKNLIRILPEMCSEKVKMYFVYPSALKSSKSITTLLEFLKSAYRHKANP